MVVMGTQLHNYTKKQQKHILFIYLFVFLPFLGTLPMAYGVSQARGLIGAVAAGLRHSHSNVGSELHL